MELKPYLTAKNIAIAVLIIATVAFLLLWLSKPKPVIVNDTANKVLVIENQRLQKEIEELQVKLQIQRGHDSALIKTYEDRIWADYQTIESLKKKRDEKIDRINNYSSDSIRKAFSEL